MFKPLRVTAILGLAVALTAFNATTNLDAQQSAPISQTFSLASLASVAPVMDCAQLTGVDLSPAVGAPTHITSAAENKDAQPAPYCDVKGYVEPSIRFEVRLPLAKWTQRFLQTGCGGLCGMVSIRGDREGGCAPATSGELVMASTDMGHQGGMADDGSWGSKDYQLRIDFAYRGVHLTAVAAKALIAKYYGQAPKYSYFQGCSDGGREALIEAQRYPDDFDGITAGAAAMNFTTQNSFYHGWNVDANKDDKGQWILTAAQLPILHKLAIEQCDALDGVKDGLISDPLRCHVDPALVECKPGQDQATCLTPEQVRVAREIYTGAHDSKGNKLVLSGPLPGSELGWAGVLIPPSPNAKFVLSVGASESALKHLLYEQDPPASFTDKDLQFTVESFNATTQLHKLYDATDPDLTPFAAHGGKLILWHGYADQHISPLNTIAYYTAMQKLLGEKKVDSFTRLFLFPGGYHCGDGEGPFEYPLLASIMAWVEAGKSPDVMIASHSSHGKGGLLQGVPGDMRGGAMGGPEGPARGGASNNIDRTRPVYPYPYVARYTGSGSSDDARNFVKGEAKPVSAEQLKWLGEGFYSAHFQQWCHAKGMSLECSAAAQK